MAKAEDITYTLEECKDRLSHTLYKKLEYSVNLIRKAERIALSYDNANGYYLAFSGGKDSQVLYHVAKVAGVRFGAHMNLTSVDPAPVIRFVKLNYPSVELIKPRMSIFQDAVKRKILPTMRVRWCCADFKESAGAGRVTLIGIRHEESARRARRNEVEINSRKFSGTLEELDKYREEKTNRTNRKSQSVNITNASGERTLGCISGKESLLISPIIHWTEAEVWEFLNALKVPHCELYDQGWTRIGCILCPMSSQKQKAREMQMYPHVKANWLKAIKLIRGGGYSKKNMSGGTLGGATLPPKFYATNQHWPVGSTSTAGFLDSSSSDGLTEEQKEDLIAEAIFDWWISGKSYKKWYAEKYLQTKMDFDTSV